MKPSEVKILIVDDDMLLLETIVELFKPFQFQIDAATNGLEAWNLIQKKTYNLVLTDVRMPNMDGIELTKHVKSLDPTKPSILFMSGYSDILNEEILHLGAEGKFEKPFNINAVRSALETCLLAPEERWSKKTNFSKLLEIHKSVDTLVGFEQKKSIFFGRGGFFVSHAMSPVQKETAVSFTIELSSPEPVIFKGIGITQWSCGYSAKYPAGLGVKIISMAPEQAKIYNQLFSQRVPFIPSPRKMGRD